MFTVDITSDNLVKVRHHWTTYSDECGQDYVVLIRRINLHFYYKSSSGLEGPVSHTRWQTTEKETREGSLKYWYYRALAGGGWGGGQAGKFKGCSIHTNRFHRKKYVFHRKTGSRLATIGSGNDQIHRMSYGIRWIRIESSVLHRNDRFSVGEAEVESALTIISNCDARGLIEKKISHQFMETSTLPNNISWYIH